VRQLEVVAVSDDGAYVLLAGAEDAVRATHSVRIDNRLRAALRGQLDDNKDRRESELSPKEIQSRLRAGDAPEQIAKAARVPVSRVMRYAGPVYSERDRIVEHARAAVLQRPRGPELTTPLGEVVDKRLASTVGLRPATVAWTARRRDDGAWVVVLSYSARGGARTATWLWEPAERLLTSLNALATRLGAPDPTPVRRRRAASPAKRAAAKPKRSSKAAPKLAAKAGSKAGSKAPASKPAPRKRREAPGIESPAVDRVNGRAVMPSWDDVLLGVQSPAAARGRRRT
jgi:Protein of unknown function (DUF3071)